MIGPTEALPDQTNDLSQRLVLPKHCQTRRMILASGLSYVKNAHALICIYDPHSGLRPMKFRHDLCTVYCTRYHTRWTDSFEARSLSVPIKEGIFRKISRANERKRVVSRIYINRTWCGVTELQLTLSTSIIRRYTYRQYPMCVCVCVCTYSVYDEHVTIFPLMYPI